VRDRIHFIALRVAIVLGALLVGLAIGFFIKDKL